MAKQGKKQRKFGRSSRSPSGKYYKIVSRWKTNKAKRIEKDNKRKKRDKEKIYKVPRGTARAKRRGNLLKAAA